MPSTELEVAFVRRAAEILHPLSAGHVESVDIKALSAGQVNMILEGGKTSLTRISAKLLPMPGLVQVTIAVGIMADGPVTSLPIKVCLLA